MNEDDSAGALGRRLTRWFLLIVALAVAASIVFLTAYGLQFSGPLSSERDAWGQFGDYIGGVLNPFFSLLGLLGLLMTIFIQSRELHLSTRELRNSANALSQQNESIRRQNFESTFFQLIRLQADIADSLEIRDNNHRVTGTGRDCFRVHYDGAFVTALKKQAAGMRGDDLTVIREAYKRFYSSRQAAVGHYFRHLYHLVLFAKENAPADPYAYVRLARAQLSSYELALLFYNCLSEVGEKFKPLVEEFSLLHNMDKSVLVNQDHLALYGASAFERPGANVAAPPR